MPRNKLILLVFLSEIQSHSHEVAGLGSENWVPPPSLGHRPVINV